MTWIGKKKPTKSCDDPLIFRWCKKVFSTEGRACKWRYVAQRVTMCQVNIVMKRLKKDKCVSCILNADNVKINANDCIKTSFNHSWVCLTLLYQLTTRTKVFLSFVGSRNGFPSSSSSSVSSSVWALWGLCSVWRSYMEINVNRGQISLYSKYEK